MYRPVLKLISLAALFVASAASAAPSQETIWYGSDRATTAATDADSVKVNVTLIQDCLKEHKHDKASCVGITKSYCYAEQPTCNIQEAMAWNSLASKKPKSQSAWLRQAEKACAYSPKANGYAVNPHDPWADKLAPSGCVLQRSASRVIHARRR